MSDERRDLMLLLALGALWGTSYLLIKLAITEIPPASLTALRMCVAAMVLLAWCAARKVPLAGLRAVWPFTISCALLGNILPFTLIAWAELSIDSATAALLLAFAPIGGMVMAHMFSADERLSLNVILGASGGLAGLLLLLAPESGPYTSTAYPLAKLAVILAGLCYGANALSSKRLRACRPEAAATAVMLAAAGMSAPLAAFVDQPWALNPSITALGIGAILGVFQTALAALLLVVLITRRGAIYFAQVNYLVPVFGALVGIVFLGERVGPQHVIGITVILISLAIAQARMKLIRI